MRKALITLTFLGLVALAATHLHSYSAANAGIFIDLPGNHWCGLEYRGNPGAFCDVS